MQEVGVLAETVAIGPDLVEVLSVGFELALPGLIRVVATCVLQPAQDVLVVVSDARDLFDPHCPIERAV